MFHFLRCLGFWPYKAFKGLISPLRALSGTVRDYWGCSGAISFYLIVFLYSCLSSPFLDCKCFEANDFTESNRREIVIWQSSSGIIRPRKQTKHPRKPNKTTGENKKHGRKPTVFIFLRRFVVFSAAGRAEPGRARPGRAMAPALYLN